MTKTRTGKPNQQNRKTFMENCPFPGLREAAMLISLRLVGDSRTYHSKLSNPLPLTVLPPSSVVILEPLVQQSFSCSWAPTYLLFSAFSLVQRQ